MHRLFFTTDQIDTLSTSEVVDIAFAQLEKLYGILANRKLAEEAALSVQNLVILTHKAGDGRPSWAKKATVWVQPPKPGSAGAAAWEPEVKV